MRIGCNWMNRRRHRFFSSKIDSSGRFGIKSCIPSLSRLKIFGMHQMPEFQNILTVRPATSGAALFKAATVGFFASTSDLFTNS